MYNLKPKGIFKSKKLAFFVTSIAILGVLGTKEVHASPQVERYSGINRYETAARVCDAGWDSSDYAVIVNGENYPDALAAAPLAAKYDAPILLTGADTLNAYTSSEISRLNVKNVFIVGGKGVVSQSVEDSLKSKDIKVTRLSGDDRYETALAVAKKVGKSKEVILVNGNDFRDGMTIASIAALKEIPIILTDGAYMPADVKKYLNNTSKMDQVYVVGDANTISDGAISSLSNVKRIGTGNAYGKNVSVIEAFAGEIDTSTLYIASAKDFPDSLGASALAYKTSSPVLFVDSPMDQATSTFLKSHIVNNLKVLGGSGSISYDLETIAKNLPLDIGSTNNFTDTIWQDEKYTPRATVVVTATDGTKKEVPVEWNLTNINTTKPGIYTFTGILSGSDKTVYTTLTVKPLPYKIDNLTETANSKDSYRLPTTVTAQMTDGTTDEVAVTWDYGTQSGNKPGVYVFNGTVDKYSKKVKLTLTITAGSTKTIKSIANIKVTVAKKSDYTRPTTVEALMSDGSTEDVAVTWGNETKYDTGVYTYEGTVSGYSKKVGLMLIVTGEGGTDPNDPDYPDNPDNPDDSKDLGELDAIMQDESYPTTVKDPSTGKQVAVTWTEAVSIDSNFEDSGEYIDDCRIAKFTLKGTLKDGTEVKATIGIIPRIITLNVDNGTSNVPAIVINVRRSDYPGGAFNMSDLSDRINAVIKKPDGTREAKKVHILLWNPPVIDISDSNTYYVTATIKYYSSPVTVTIRVTD